MKHKVQKQEKPHVLFSGEVMICAACALMKKSDPHEESGWTVIEDEMGKVFYLCPQCFSNWLTDARHW